MRNAIKKPCAGHQHEPTFASTSFFTVNGRTLSFLSGIRGLRVPANEVDLKTRVARGSACNG
jgi:hypothetical protein